MAIANSMRPFRLVLSLLATAVLALVQPVSNESNGPGHIISVFLAAGPQSTFDGFSLLIIPLPAQHTPLPDSL